MTIRDRYPTVAKPERFDKGTFAADEIKLFPALQSEPEDIVGYLRTGGCTAGCGACCEAFVIPLQIDGLEDDDFVPVVHGQIILPIDPTARGKVGGDDWEYWLNLHEVYLFTLPSGLLTAAVPIQAEKPSGTMTFDGWMAWLETKGITFLRRVGQQVLAYVNIRCTKLSGEGLCTVFGTPERPQMCSPYPEHPLDVEGIDFCTYNFQEIKRDQVKELARPAPRPKLQQPKRKSKKGRKR